MWIERGEREREAVRYDEDIFAYIRKKQQKLPTNEQKIASKNVNKCFKWERETKISEKSEKRGREKVKNLCAQNMIVAKQSL